MEQPPLKTLQLFHYYPNKPLAIVGLAVYALFAVYLIFRIFKSKSARFIYILPITALMEAAGYLVRIMCTGDNTTLGKYIAMTMFLLLAPNALALVNYKAVGEVIRLSNVQKTRFFLRPKFVTWFFFSSDVFAFFMQGAGGGLQSTGNPDSSKMGAAITLVGLSLQLVFFACFALITVYVNRNPAYNYYIEGQPDAKGKLIRCMYITLALLYVRSIYRVAEYATGFDGPVASAEWAFYVFDGLAIAISFVFYCIMFIGNYLPKRGATLDDGMIAQNVSSHSTVTSSDNLTQLENGIEMHNAGGNKYAVA